MRLRRRRGVGRMLMPFMSGRGSRRDGGGGEQSGGWSHILHNHTKTSDTKCMLR
jgi:hypothetical protein